MIKPLEEVEVEEAEEVEAITMMTEGAITITTTTIIITMTDGIMMTEGRNDSRRNEESWRYKNQAAEIKAQCTYK